MSVGFKDSKARVVLYCFVGVIFVVQLVVLFHDRQRIFRAILFNLTDSTVYAQGFSWSSFSKVEKGMSAQEVKDFLGEPLFVSRPPAKNPFGNEQWFYTEPGETGNFKTAGVVVNASNHVTEKFSSYYFD